MAAEQDTSKRPSKPSTLYGRKLDWQEYEAGDPGEDALSVIVDGWELLVGRKPEDDGFSKTEWDWSVKATSQISETPELWDAGVAKSLGGAQTSAGEKANAARRSSYKAQAKQWDAEHADEVAKATEAKAKKTPVPQKASRVEPTEQEQAEKNKTRRGKVASGAVKVTA